MATLLRISHEQGNLVNILLNLQMIFMILTNGILSTKLKNASTSHNGSSVEHELLG